MGLREREEEGICEKGWRGERKGGIDDIIF